MKKSVKCFLLGITAISLAIPAFVGVNGGLSSVKAVESSFEEDIKEYKIHSKLAYSYGFGVANDFRLVFGLAKNIDSFISTYSSTLTKCGFYVTKYDDTELLVDLQNKEVTINNVKQDYLVKEDDTCYYITVELGDVKNNKLLVNKEFKVGKYTVNSGEEKKWDLEDDSYSFNSLLNKYLDPENPYECTEEQLNSLRKCKDDLSIDNPVTVYLDAGEGKVDMATIKVSENEPYSLPKARINKMELDWEYGFDCWTLDGVDIPSSGSRWTYGSDKTLVAKYKLRDDDEYLESKYDFALENGTYTLNHKEGIEHQYVYVPSTYKGKNITRIGYHAFAGEVSLLAVSFSDTLTAIDDHAFHSCENLKSVVIPDSVTTLGKFVFRYCYALESVVLSKNLVTIPAYAFENNTALVSVNIPSSVKYIEEAAFFHCPKLETIFIPRSVETINFLSFRFCDNLNFTCEALSKPEGWQDNWNSGRPVIWGYGHTYNISYPNWPNDVTNPNPTSNTVPNEITLDQHAFDNYSKYIFMGYVDKDNKPITTISKFIHDDIEIYADYAKKDITLTLQEYGTATISYNGAYELPTLPNKQAEGGEYIFDHWTLNGNTIPLSGEHWTYSKDNATLVPSYNFLNHYTITYVSNGGSINPQNPTIYTVNDDVVLHLSTKTGCEFDGWYLSPDFTGDKVEGWSAGSKQGNITLYAKFNLKEYPIFYDNWPSDILDNPNPETYTIEDEVVFYTDSTGKFKTLKYLTSKEGQPITKIEKGTTGPIFLNIDYELQTTDLVFNAAGGLFPNPQDERFIFIDYCMDDMEKEKVIVPTVGDTSSGFNINSKAPYHKGYNFAGWYLDKGYTTRISDNNILSSGDIIYAKWEKLPEDGFYIYDSLANPQFGYWQINRGEYLKSYQMYIPYNMESIQLYVNFSNNSETGDGTLAEFDISTNKSSNPIFKLERIDYPCTYETPLIDLKNLECLEYFLSLYASDSGGSALFDTMFKQCNYKKQYIKVADIGPCYAQAIYSEMVTLPNNPYREGYTFAGWVDKDDNLIDFSKPWSRKDTSLELSAKWVKQ